MRRAVLGLTVAILVGPGVARAAQAPTTQAAMKEVAELRAQLKQPGADVKMICRRLGELGDPGLAPLAELLATPEAAPAAGVAIVSSLRAGLAENVLILRYEPSRQSLAAIGRATPKLKELYTGGNKTAPGWILFHLASRVPAVSAGLVDLVVSGKIDEKDAPIAAAALVKADAVQRKRLATAGAKEGAATSKTISELVELFYASPAELQKRVAAAPATALAQMMAARPEMPERRVLIKIEQLATAPYSVESLGEAPEIEKPALLKALNHPDFKVRLRVISMVPPEAATKAMAEIAKRATTDAEVLNLLAQTVPSLGEAGFKAYLNATKGNKELTAKIPAIVGGFVFSHISRPLSDETKAEAAKAIAPLIGEDLATSIKALVILDRLEKPAVAAVADRFATMSDAQVTTLAKQVGTFIAQMTYDPDKAKIVLPNGLPGSPPRDGRPQDIISAARAAAANSSLNGAIKAETFVRGVDEARRVESATAVNARPVNKETQAFIDLCTSNPEAARKQVPEISRIVNPAMFAAVKGLLNGADETGRAVIGQLFTRSLIQTSMNENVMAVAELGFNDPAPLVRQMTLMDLSRRDGMLPADTFQAMLEGSVPGERDAVMKIFTYLGQNSHPQGGVLSQLAGKFVPALRKAVADPDVAVRKLAASAVGALISTDSKPGDVGFDFFQELLASNDVEVKRAAFGHLQRRVGDRVMEGYLNSSDPDLKHVAMIVLWRGSYGPGHPQHIPDEVLVAAMRNPSWHARAFACRHYLLRSQGKGVGGQPREAVLYQVAADPSPEIAATALDMLIRRYGGEVIGPSHRAYEPQMKAAISGPSASRVAAIQTLTTQGVAGFRMLIEASPNILSDPDAAVRNAMFSAARQAIAMEIQRQNPGVILTTQPTTAQPAR